MIQIPVYEPLLQGREKEYVMDCLESNWISSKGSYVNEFEKAFSNYIGNRFSIATSNGTTALHLAMLALGIGEGDEVIVPTFTYIASVNCISYVGATPVFVDSNLDTWQLDLDQVEKKIGEKTKAIIAVHLYGNCCDLERLRKICDDHNIYLVEDCAEAIGTYYKNNHVGNLSDISTFSFFGNKTITTGEGGMVCTNDSFLKDRIELFKGQGVSQDIEYWHEVIGYNYRMTNICAAIGLAQLENIEKVLVKKQEIIACYKNELEEVPVSFVQDEGVNSHWMISIVVENEYHRNDLRDYLGNHGIETRPFFHPIHLMNMYKGKEDSSGYPNAIKLSQRGLNLPSSPVLTEVQIKYICNKIKHYFCEQGGKR